VKYKELSIACLVNWKRGCFLMGFRLVGLAVREFGVVMGELRG
jgi:hypothetical protein